MQMEKGQLDEADLRKGHTVVTLASWYYCMHILDDMCFACLLLVPLR